MDLLGEHQPVRSDAHRPAEAVKVFQHMVLTVAAAAAQVQGVPRGGADAAFPGGKAMGAPAQQGRSEPDQIVLHMCGERHEDLL